MNRNETKQILMRIQALYPNWHPSAPLEIVVDAWNEMLDDFTYAQVLAAVKAFIRSESKGFAPSIGQITEKLQTLFGESGSANEMEAWSMVLKAVRNSGYHSEEEFAKLPAVVQKAVVSPGQLREWALQDNMDGRAMNVMQSNFLRTYRAEVEHEKELQKMQPAVRAMIEAASPKAIEAETHSALSMDEQRRIAGDRAIPMPERARDRLKELLGED